MADPIVAKGASRDPTTGRYLTRKQLQEKYKLRDEYSFNPDDGLPLDGSRKTKVENDGSNAQCMWASSDLATGIFWLITAGVDPQKSIQGPFGTCSSPWGYLAGVLGVTAMALGTVATGCCSGETNQAMYMPFEGVKVVYALLGFCIMAWAFCADGLSMNWGYLLLGLATIFSCVGSVHKRVNALIRSADDAASARSVQTNQQVEMTAVRQHPQHMQMQMQTWAPAGAAPPHGPPQQPGLLTAGQGIQVPLAAPGPPMPAGPMAGASSAGMGFGGTLQRHF